MSTRLLSPFFVLLLSAPLGGRPPAAPAGGQTSEPFRRLDRNGDGKLTKDEFGGPLFDRIDADRDGVVTADEDRQFLRQRAGEEGRAAGNRPPGNRPPGNRPPGNRAADNRADGGRGAVGGARPRMRVPDTVAAELDIPYAATDNPRQRLDLYLPKTRRTDKPLPVVVFIHGGGWRNGDKGGGYGTVGPLVESGEYAGVSVGYRLSGEAIWPAQIHDCKAAIRWIKANAGKYGLDPERIGVTGTSAGGHLVAMLGTSGDVAALEGSLGEHTGVSSRVACVADQYGPTELAAMGGRHDDAASPESLLIGGSVPENKEAARNASPTSYVSKDDPPFLLIHGTDDPAVPFNQSELLAAALKKAGVDAVLVPVEGGGHGNFATPAVPDRLRQFFDKHLLGKQVTVATTPIAAGGKR